MSISTPAGGDRRPSAKPAAGAKPTARGKSSPAAKPAAEGRPAGRTGDRPSGGRDGGKGSGGKGSGRPPAVPVKVRRARSWGSITLFTVVGLLAIAIVGFGVYEVHQSGLGWQDKANGIPGIIDYRKTDPGILTRNHKYGVIKYKVSPPVGGDHNPNWQRCAGDVYDAPIANEHAVHSLEHGAVWITYRPDLAPDQVNILKTKVRSIGDFILMSPYPGLSSPISLQAWGYQLKVDKATDPRIDSFITDLRVNAAMEPNAPCSTGDYITATGTTPHDLGESPGASPGAPAPGMAPAGAPTN